MGAYFLQAFGKGPCQVLWKSKSTVSLGPLLSARSLNPSKKFLDRQVRISFQKSHAESAPQCDIYPYTFLHSLLQVLQFLQTYFSILNPSRTKAVWMQLYCFQTSIRQSEGYCAVSPFSKFSASHSTIEMHFRLSSNYCQLLRYRAESMAGAWIQFITKKEEKERKGKGKMLSNYRGFVQSQNTELSRIYIKKRSFYW